MLDVRSRRATATAATAATATATAATAIRFLEIALLTAWGLFVLFPLYWMIVTALRPTTVVMRIPPVLLPKGFTLTNFLRLFARSVILRWTLNSVLHSGGVTALAVVLCTLAGYVLAKHRFPGRVAIFWLVVGQLMIPWYLRLLPMFLIVKRLGWIDSFAALIVPAAVTPWGIFLMKQYLETLPSDLIEAARIDGCGELGIFCRIVLPIAKPGMAVLGIYSFMDTWNSFVWPLVVTSSTNMRTLQVGLATLQEGLHTAVDYGLLMSGATVAAIPMVVFFLSVQRYFVRGITVGALKG